MKKLMLVTSLAMAAAALAVPSTASAVWIHNHVHLQAGNNPLLHGEGTMSFTSAIGGVHCTQVTSTVQITGGQTTAHTQQFTFVIPSCKTTAALAGCTIKALTPENLPWLGHISNTVGIKTGVKILVKLTGFLCPPEFLIQTGEEPTKETEKDGETVHTKHLITIQPEETGVVGAHTTVTGMILSGTVTLTTGSGSFLALGTPVGTLTATPGGSHTYGYT